MFDTVEEVTVNFGVRSSNDARPEAEAEDDCRDARSDPAEAVWYRDDAVRGAMYGLGEDEYQVSTEREVPGSAENIASSPSLNRPRSSSSAGEDAGASDPGKRPRSDVMVSYEL